MVTLYAFKFNENLTVSIGGQKRQDFKKGAKIIVTYSDYLPLLRMGLTFLWEAVLTLKDVEKLIVSPEDKEAEDKKAAEAAATTAAEEALKVATDALEALKNPTQE